MAKKKKSRAAAVPRKIKIGGWLDAKGKVGVEKTKVKLARTWNTFAETSRKAHQDMADNYSKFSSKKIKAAREKRASMATDIAETAREGLILARRKLKKTQEEREEQAGKVVQQIEGKIGSFLKEKTLSRKILRKGPRPVLDLRRRPEREIPVKQHGFKEGEIGHGNFLFD